MDADTSDSRARAELARRGVENMSGANLPMTEEERAIWRAAYAAEFVAQFRNSERDWNDNGASIMTNGFDEAAKQISAERAITVADLAVECLREWRRDEEPAAGVAFSPYPRA